MKIDRIVIDGINGVKHLEINFNKRLNLICGENGVGKTTILKSIMQPFLCGENNCIKKHYGFDIGNINVFIEGEDYVHLCATEEFDMEETNHYNSDIEAIDISDNILYFPTTRTIEYDKLLSLPSVYTKGEQDIHSALALNTGVQQNIKSWFINRFIFSYVNNSLNKIQLDNLKLAQHVIELLDKNLKISKVTPDFEILVKDRGNEVYFEMLSDGYKSCIFILFGIIKEIEIRFPNKEAINFDGVIMIDEIDIHLHPQWQAKLVTVLKETFLKAQIIVTTHSPSVLQNANAEEIIPLYKDENGDVHIKELHLGEYGLQGWTLEEIMKDVMGMESTTSDLYAKVMNEFDQAMKEEDIKAAKEKYELLNKLWHPDNVLRQLLKIQMAGMEE